MTLAKTKQFTRTSLVGLALAALAATAGASDATVNYGSDGALRYWSVETPVPGPKSASSPGAAATRFVLDRRDDFGLASPQVGLEVTGVWSDADRAFVKLRQTYAGLPVYAYGLVVQVDAATGSVVAVLSDVLTDTSALDDGAVALSPAVSAGDAAAAAVAHGASLAGASDVAATAAPRLVVYAPAVVGAGGAVRLAWQIPVA